MRLTRLLTVAVLAAVSCTQDATMQIRVTSGEHISEVEWDIHVARGPGAPSEGLGGDKDLENPQCSWF